MRRLLLLVAGLPALLLAGPAAGVYGGWGSGGCGPVGPPAFFAPPVMPFSAPEPLRWAWDGDQWDLLQGDHQVGAYNGSHYLPRLGDGWGAECAPPIRPPAGATKRGCKCGAECCSCKRCKCTPAKRCCPKCGCGKRGATEQAVELLPAPKDVPNYGIDRSEDHFSGVERHTVCGREVTEGEARRLVGADLPADSKRPWAVYVGRDAAECKAAAGRLAALSSLFRVQVYTQGDPGTTDRNGKVVYLPGLTLALPDGTQLSHQATLVEAGTAIDRLRIAPPDFDPARIPDLLRPPPPPPAPKSPDAGPAAGVPIEHLCCLGGCAAVVLLAAARRYYLQRQV